LSTQATFKPRDVEEPIDFYVNRPLASILVKGLAPLPITPNQVTVLSGVTGLIGGVVIATAPLHGSWQIPVAGVIFYFSLLLDCADGQLARLRGESSLVGRFLDGFIDAVVVGAWFIGFAVFLYRLGYNFWLINVIGWSAGYSVRWQVHFYDHAKNLYLANTRPEGERARSFPTIEEIAQLGDEMAARGDRFGAACMRGFIMFTEAQRKGWQLGRIGMGLPGTRTDPERELYRARFEGIMRLWVWNGLGFHLVLCVLTCFAVPFLREAHWVMCFFFLGPMNAFSAYIVWREKKTERELQAELRPA
jgi:hypothetical protein